MKEIQTKEPTEFPDFQELTLREANLGSTSQVSLSKHSRLFRDFFLRNSQIWRPEKSQMHRWNSGPGADSGNDGAAGEPQRKGLKMHSTTNGITETKGGIPADKHSTLRHRKTPESLQLMEERREANQRQDQGQDPRANPINPSREMQQA